MEAQGQDTHCLTCCFRWVSCCFISSHILWDSTASLRSYFQDRTSDLVRSPKGLCVFCQTHQNPLKCPALTRHQPFPYNRDYELSQNPTHLLQDPPTPEPEPHKILLPLVPLLRLLQHLLGLLELGVHQLLLQVLVLEDFVDMLQESRVGGVHLLGAPFPFLRGRPNSYRLQGSLPSLPSQPDMLDSHVYHRTWAPRPWKVYFPTSPYFSL